MAIESTKQYNRNRAQPLVRIFVQEQFKIRWHGVVHMPRREQPAPRIELESIAVDKISLFDRVADLAAEARRKPREKPAARETSPKIERRQRAQQFLRDELARGPKRVTDVEEAAAKAHVDPKTLEQARADLGVLVSRSNTGRP